MALPPVPLADRFFDPDSPRQTSRRRLPHWTQASCYTLVTFRLADAVPAAWWRSWSEERAVWLREHAQPWSAAEQAEYEQRFPQRLNQWLDEGHGSAVLGLDVGRFRLRQALSHFHGQRYDLDAVAIAVSHVHVLVRPRPGWTIGRLVQSWKIWSARQLLAWPEVQAVRARHGLGPSDPFWQREYYDHLIRHPASLASWREHFADHPLAWWERWLEEPPGK